MDRPERRIVLAGTAELERKESFYMTLSPRLHVIDGDSTFSREWKPDVVNGTP